MAQTITGAHRIRSFASTAVLVCSALVLTGCGAETPAANPANTAIASDTAVESLLNDLTEEQFATRGLTSLVAQIRLDGREIATVSLGESMSGVPITRDGRFRNGAVAIMYVAATMLAMADEGLVDLDEPISRWLPGVAAGDSATLRMLASMTAGYPDHVANEDFLDAVVANAFRAWTEDELLGYSEASPRLFAPGENWDYSHAGYILLGRVLSVAGDAPLDELITKYVLEPLALDGTVADVTAQIPEPVVHGFTSERGVYEDSTYWNPSWTLPAGAIQTSTIDDMASSFDAIVGRGELLSSESHEAMIAPSLVGFGAPLEGCRSCHTLTTEWNYGLGVFLREDWVLQTPLFGGYQSAVATLPASRSEQGSVTIAVSAVPGPNSYTDWHSALSNWALELTIALATELVPTNPPPAFLEGHGG